jgi:hypothetical protein
MKTCLKVFWGLFLTFGLVSSLSAAPQFGRNRGRDRGDAVCVYKDIQFQGPEQCFYPGDSVTSIPGLGGQVSSIRINGSASVTVYDSTNFRGHSTTFTSTMPDLGQVRLDSKSWSDRIQSLQVSSGNDAYYGRNNGDYGDYRNNRNSRNTSVYGQQVSEGVCVYDRPNYQGRSQCWSAGEQLGDLGRAGNWSDRIESMRVFGGTRVLAYRDIGFRGGNVIIDRDVSDLARLSGNGFRNWDRQISSLRIENPGGYNYPRRLGRSRY